MQPTPAVHGQCTAKELAESTHAATSIADDPPVEEAPSADKSTTQEAPLIIPGSEGLPASVLASLEEAVKGGSLRKSVPEPIIEGLKSLPEQGA